MFQAYNDNQKPPTGSPNLISSHVEIELRFQSERCAVSGNPLCFLQITLRSIGNRWVSLNRMRPIIDFADAKDGEAPTGLPLLSFCHANDKSNNPIFSYQLDLCYQEDREALMDKSNDVKPDDCIILSTQGYTFTHCINHPWDYIFTYDQISKLRVNKRYKVCVGLYSKAEGQSFWYRRPQEVEVEHVPLFLDPVSNNVVELVE